MGDCGGGVGKEASLMKHLLKNGEFSGKNLARWCLLQGFAI
jgi:hypothetical protein